MFDPSPILTAPTEIQIHAFAATVALILGPVALYGSPGAALHRISGYVWVVAMATTALSAFAIHSFPLIGPFSPIHGLAIFALWSLWTGMRQVFARNIRGHRNTMRSLYWNGLILAGLANFLPGRATNRVLVPDQPELGWLVIALGLLGVVAMAVRNRTRQASAA